MKKNNKKRNILCIPYGIAGIESDVRSKIQDELKVLSVPKLPVSGFSL